MLILLTDGEAVRLPPGKIQPILFLSYVVLRTIQWKCAADSQDEGVVQEIFLTAPIQNTVRYRYRYDCNI